MVVAADSPDLGDAESFAILANTYTNTVDGTTIYGDFGYTTPPDMVPKITGATHHPPDDPKYTQAGIDQGAALIDLNSQPAGIDNSFPCGVDLSGLVTSAGTGVFSPGVYEIDGAASISADSSITL